MWRALFVVVLVACSRSNSAPAPQQDPNAATPFAKTETAAAQAAGAQAAQVSSQIERGKQLFADHCAECHGTSGQGTHDGPPLVGTGVLPLEPRAGSKRDVKLRTAGDVYVFAMRNMPADDPASLPADAYLAIVAFAISANGVTLAAPLDAEQAQTIALH